MKVSVDNKEVVWVSGNRINIGDQSVKALKTYIGELADSFLPTKIGSGCYEWEVPGNEWTRLSQASPVEVTKARTAYADLCRKVRTAVENAQPVAKNFIENVLTVPNEDYIFFKENTITGEVDVLIAAWGFRNHKMADGGPIRKRLASEKSQDVTLVVMCGDVPLPEREITIKFPYQQVPSVVSTDADGRFHFQQEIGEHEKIIIVDRKTGKSFEVVVEVGKSDYVLDVPVTSKVVVSATIGDSPMAGASIMVEYDGMTREMSTDENGVSSFELSYVPHAIVAVALNGERQQQEANFAGNSFVFNFAAPVEPVTPETEPDVPERITVRATVKVNGKCVQNEPVVVLYAGESHELKTDDNGVALCECDYVSGEEITVDVRSNIQKRVAEKVENNFDFDLDVPVARTVVLKFEDDKEKALSGVEISVAQGDTKKYTTLGEDGVFAFEDTGFRRGESVDVQVALKDGNKIVIPFVLDENEDEYLLTWEYKDGKSYLFLWILLAFILLAVCCYFIAPHFVELAQSCGDDVYEMLN